MSIKSTKKNIIIILALMFSSVIFADDHNILIYTSRSPILIEPIVKEFEKDSDIKVKIHYGKAADLLRKIKQEKNKKNSADLLIIPDVGNLEIAAENGSLADIKQSKLSWTPKIHSNKWLALSKRARVIVYDKTKLSLKEKALVKNYTDLANPKLKGKICIRSSSNVYNQSLVAYFLTKNSPKTVEKFLKKLVNNFARTPQGNDRDQIKAVLQGICDFAVVNTYYIGLLNKTNPELNIPKKVGVIFPVSGTHVNISGIGIIKKQYSIVKENELYKLINFFLSNQGQEFYAKSNFEYPVNKNTKIAPIIANLGKLNDIKDENFVLTGKLNKQAILVMDKAGWK